ncbi:hypothetical protein SprV_0401682900 [Sparganum proliferum]
MVITVYWRTVFAESFECYFQNKAFLLLLKPGNLAQNRPASGREVKTGAAVYEANQIAVKAKREARKSQVSRLLNANSQPFPTRSRCQRTFRARIGLVGYLRKQVANSPTTPTSPPTFAPSANTKTTPVTADHTVAAPPPPSALPRPLNPPQRPTPTTPPLHTLPPPVVGGPIIGYPHHQQPHSQLCGLGPYLSALRSHIRPKDRPGR